MTSIINALSIPYVNYFDYFDNIALFWFLEWWLPILTYLKYRHVDFNTLESYEK